MPNYLGEDVIRDSYGNQIGTIGGKNYLGETVIRDNYGNITATIDAIYWRAKIVLTNLVNNSRTPSLFMKKL